MAYSILNRYSNASNPGKTQRNHRECNTGRTLYDPRDIKAREGEIMSNKRARWKAELLDQIPPERVYMAVSDTPPGAPETGVVTHPSNINVVWDRQAGKLVYATSYSQALSAPRGPKVQKHAGWGNGKSRQGGGV